MLERLVVRNCILQYAKETGIRIEDSQLSALNRIAAQNKLSLDEFVPRLLKKALPLIAFVNKFVKNYVLARLREREVDNKIVITDTEVDNLIATQRNTGTQHSYHFCPYLVPVPDNASPEALAQRLKVAQEALQQLQAGKPFAQIAAQNTSSTRCTQRGDLGWASAGTLPEAFL